MFGKKYELVARITWGNRVQTVVIAKGNLSRVSQYAMALNEAEPFYPMRISKIAAEDEKDDPIPITVGGMFYESGFKRIGLSSESKVRIVTNSVLRRLWEYRLRICKQHTPILTTTTNCFDPCERDEVGDLEKLMNSLAYLPSDRPTFVFYFFREYIDPVIDLNDIASIGL